MKEVIVNGVKWSPFLVSTTPKRARFSLSSTQWTGRTQWTDWKNSKPQQK